MMDLDPKRHAPPKYITAIWKLAGTLTRAVYSNSCGDLRAMKRPFWTHFQSKPLQDLIAKLQLEDLFMRKKLIATKVQASCKKDQELEGSKWHFQDNKMLYYTTCLYIPPNEALRSELFACFHDNMLAGHFSEKRTLKLI